MMERVVSGKTVDEAVAGALETMGVAREFCTVEVLEEPSRGLFGLGLLAQRDARVRVAVTAGKAAVAGAFVVEAARLIGIEADIAEVEEDEQSIELVVAGGDVAGLIGHHGQTLDALQWLADASAARRCEDRRRLIVDVNGYRRRRRRTLEEMARRAARQVRRAGRPIELDAMSAAERRIVHLALQDDPAVTTESTGDEPHRRVVILPAD